jgi:predicted RNase H-like HicB family nuclease
MTLDEWVRVDARRSYVVYWSRTHADYVCQVRDPGGLPAVHELHGDTRAEAVEAATDRLGLDK